MTTTDAAGGRWFVPLAGDGTGADAGAGGDRVRAYADEIMAQIAEDQRRPFPWGKQIPRDVPSFSALHDYCDANMYLIDAVGEGGGDPDGWNDLLNRVSDEVDRRLRAAALAKGPQLGGRGLEVLTQCGHRWAVDPAHAGEVAGCPCGMPVRLPAGGAEGGLVYAPWDYSARMHTAPDLTLHGEEAKAT